MLLTKPVGDWGLRGESPSGPGSGVGRRDRGVGPSHGTISLGLSSGALDTGRQ
jgi:hypothetical protein